ncbi:zinc metallopeptidase [Ornithinibacillus gellani]|uniref:zinc metallopeptidase n=1 Tax=Ornithinibacillus gellani TaxID=2293253 RepID=UPI000F45F4AA|nr:zinc metallopeptidase [Ornithinibacillus gellani]TQS74693.1 zinc metallopeptidase [Ornithinibacillus gellani]
MSFSSYLIYVAILMIIPLWAQSKVKSTYRKYSKVPTSSMMTGAQVARKILDDHGLYEVPVEETGGVLSDHYDPRQKVVRLSSNNFHGQSMASSAVAAHEVGHALQDQESYAFLKFRSTIVPVANIGSRLGIYLIIAGMIFSSLHQLMLVGIIFMSAAVLFQLVTLPVEFDASSRAMTQLVSTGIIRNDEERETKKVLSAAAMTYVAAALVAVAELARFIMIYASSRD